MKREQLPPELREFYFDFDWDNQKTWSLTLPVETVPISELEWHLDLPIWSSVRGLPLFDLVPRDVLRRLAAHRHHREKLKKADVSFPIDMMWSEDRYVILDGIHRLAKLKIQGAVHVKVRKIPREMIPDIQKGSVEPALGADVAIAPALKGAGARDNGESEGYGG